MREAFDEIALLMAFFFAENDYNFVVSDIVAGLLLFVHSSKTSIPAIHDYQITQSNQVSWMQFPQCIPIANRMFDISVAIYGWPTYLLNNFNCISCFKLCKKSCFKRFNKINFLLFCIIFVFFFCKI